MYIESYCEDNKENNISFTSRDVILSRNLAKPYIISTVDQILLAIFKYPGYEKVLACIYGSHITVDEVHLLEPKMFLILLYFLEFAVKHLEVKFHLMTATMPDFYKERLDKSQVRYIESNKNEVIDEDRKIKCMICKKDNWKEKVIKSVESGKKVLIVKNTINEAINAYRELKKSPEFKSDLYEINLLHSRFKFNDKITKYKDILSMKGNVWVSTQAVEISLDLDFNVVISDPAYLESIIQRMGRCNRYNKLEFGEFYIIDDESNDGVYDKQLKKLAGDLFTGKKESIMSMRDRKELLDKYYHEKTVVDFFKRKFETAESQIREIFGLINGTELNGEEIIFKHEPYLNIADCKIEASKLFRDIDLNTKVILQKDYDKFKGNYKELNKNSIAITKGIYYKFEQNNAFLKEDNFLILKDELYEYSSETGLEIVH